MNLLPVMIRVICYSRALSMRSPCVIINIQQLASDAVQQLRIEYRWKAIDQENLEIELAKELNKDYVPNLLENGDTQKQLLARSRYLLFKDETNWTLSQQQRAEILFGLHPDLETA